MSFESFWSIFPQNIKKTRSEDLTTSFSFEGVTLALPGLLPARQDPAPLLRLLRPRHDRLRRRDNHLLQRGERTTLIFMGKRLRGNYDGGLWLWEPVISRWNSRNQPGRSLLCSVNRNRPKDGPVLAT